MLSELFRVPIELWGLPFLGLGLLLGLWVLGWAGTLLVLALQGRPPSRAEVLSHLPVVLLGGAAIALAPRFAPEGIPIRGYGVMLLLASVAGVLLAVRRATQVGIHPETIYSLAFWLFIAGIVGARAFFVIEYWEVAFAPLSPWDALQRALLFTEGGLVVYGSLLGAAVAFVLFCRRKKLPVLALADVVAPSLAAGLALGRLGCLLNGCCYGGVCGAPWAVTFPAGSPPYMDQMERGEFYGIRLTDPDQPGQTGALFTAVTGDLGLDPDFKERVLTINGQGAERWAVDSQVAQAYGSGAPLELTLEGGRRVTLGPIEPRRRSLPVHPTQLYAAITAGLLAWLTWVHYPQRRRDGQTILLLLGLYPVSRFLEEAIRTDETSFLGTGLSISQNISLVMLVVAAAGWLWLRRGPEGLVRFSPFGAKFFPLPPAFYSKNPAHGSGGPR